MYEQLTTSLSGRGIWATGAYPKYPSKREISPSLGERSWDNWRKERVKADETNSYKEVRSSFEGGFWKSVSTPLGRQNPIPVQTIQKFPTQERWCCWKLKRRIKHCESLSAWWTRLLARTAWFADWSWGKEMNIMSSVPCNLCVMWRGENYNYKLNPEAEVFVPIVRPSRRTKEIGIKLFKNIAAQEVEDGDWHLSW